MSYISHLNARSIMSMWFEVIFDPLKDKKIVLPTFSENKAAVKTIINRAMVNVLAFYSGDQSSNPSTV